MAWVVLLTLGVVFIVKAGISAGWIVAGVLMFSLVVWALVMSGEYRGAIDLDEELERRDGRDARLRQQERMRLLRADVRTYGFRHDSLPTGRRGVRHVRSVGSLSRRASNRRPNRANAR